MKTIPGWIAILVGLIVIYLNCCQSKAQGQYAIEYPYKDQKVNISQRNDPTGVAIALEPAEEKQQKLFATKIEKALATIKLPNTDIELVFYEDEKPTIPHVNIYWKPKFGNNVQPYMVRIKKSQFLGRHEMVLEYIAHYVIAKIKNGDVDGTNVDESLNEVNDPEKDRRALITVFRAVGFEVYKKFVFADFDPQDKRSPYMRCDFLLEHIYNLGLMDAEISDKIKANMDEEIKAEAEKKKKKS